MSEPLAVPANPELSPGFDRARRVSRTMTVLLAIGFWVTLAWLIASSLLLFWPEAGGWGSVAGGTVIPPASLSFGSRAGAIFAIFLGTAPSVLILRHGERVFAHFAKGEVFAAEAIAHIRSAGIWLIVAAFAPAVEQISFNLFAAVRPVAHNLDLRPIMLFFGIAVYVAAYVMAEARRIADDNASFV